MTRSIITLVLLAVATPVLAQTTPGNAPTQTQTPEIKPRKFCRPEQATGSRMSKKICHTAEEWAAIGSGQILDADNQMHKLNTISRAPD